MTKKQQVRLLVVAGEASGDNHGKALLTHLGEEFDSLEVYGIGGAGMQAAGLVPLVPFATMGVFGIVDALLGYHKIKRLMRQLYEWAATKRPHAVLLIDYSGFNLRLAKQLHGLNIPVLFYSCPQVWASRKKRIAAIANYITRIAVLLPFEEELLKKHGIDARFFGHPLANLKASAAEVARLREQIETTWPEGVTVGLIPGSRYAEVKHCFSNMLKTAKALCNAGFEGRFVVPMAPSLDPAYLQQLIARHGPEGRVLLVQNAFLSLLPLLHYAICTSGSASTQVAMQGVPMLVVYKTNPLNAFLIRRLLYIRHIALFNILANQSIIPEFIQADMHPTNLTQAFWNLVNSPKAQHSMRQQCQRIYNTLHQPNPYKQAAHWFAQAIQHAQV